MVATLFPTSSASEIMEKAQSQLRRTTQSTQTSSAKQTASSRSVGTVL